MVRTTSQEQRASTAYGQLTKGIRPKPQPRTPTVVKSSRPTTFEAVL
jgi:hypothetical protein